MYRRKGTLFVEGEKEGLEGPTITQLSLSLSLSVSLFLRLLLSFFFSFFVELIRQGLWKAERLGKRVIIINDKFWQKGERTGREVLFVFLSGALPGGEKWSCVYVYEGESSAEKSIWRDDGREEEGEEKESENEIDPKQVRVHALFPLLFFSSNYYSFSSPSSLSPE